MDNPVYNQRYHPSTSVSAKVLIFLCSKDHDATLERVLNSLSLALLFLIISALNGSFSLAVLAGLSVALWASISYVSEELYTSHHSYDTPARI